MVVRVELNMMIELFKNTLNVKITCFFLKALTLLDSDVVVLIVVLLQAFLFTYWYNKQASFFIL